jgi:hypothetical protein
MSIALDLAHLRPRPAARAGATHSISSATFSQQTSSQK